MGHIRVFILGLVLIYYNKIDLYSFYFTLKILLIYKACIINYYWFNCLLKDFYDLSIVIVCFLFIELGFMFCLYIFENHFRVSKSLYVLFD